MRRVRLRDVALPRSLLCRLPAARCAACGARFARRALSRFRASLAALLSLLRPRFVCCYEYIGWKTEPAGRPLVPANACKFLANVANSWLQAACASQKREAQASGRGRHFSPFVSLTTTSSDVRSSRPFCPRRRLLCCFSCPVLHLEPQDEELSLRALCDTPTVRCAC